MKESAPVHTTFLNAMALNAFVISAFSHSTFRKAAIAIARVVTALRAATRDNVGTSGAVAVAFRNERRFMAWAVTAANA